VSTAFRVDPKTVQELLGHTTIRLTIDSYVHAMPENLRAAALAMDRVLSRVLPPPFHHQ